MLSKKIKWYLLFEDKSSLDDLFALRNTAVYKNYAGEFLLVKESEDYYAFQNRCPHQNKPLNDCKLIDGHVVCPYHKYAFSCKDGRGQVLYLQKYQLRFDENKVFIGLEKWSFF